MIGDRDEPPRRPARRARRPRRRRPPRDRLLRRSTPTPPTRPSRSRSARRATAARASTASFNEAHIVATTQAICEYRAGQGIDGPLFLGRDTHALSEPAWVTALEVLVANDVTVLVDAADRFTPTPAVSHAILRANGGRTTGAGLADGIVVTPSHNPPTRRRLQVQPAPRRARPTPTPPAGSPARANELLAAGLAGVAPGAVRRRPAPPPTPYDFLGHVRRRPADRRRHRRHPRRRRAHRRRPARRRQRRLLGRRSPSATGSTSPSSTRSSTRRGGS